MEAYKWIPDIAVAVVFLIFSTLAMCSIIEQHKIFGREHCACGKKQLPAYGERPQFQYCNACLSIITA